MLEALDARELVEIRLSVDGAAGAGAFLVDSTIGQLTVADISQCEINTNVVVLTGGLNDIYVKGEIIERERGRGRGRGRRRKRER